jgi:hypothetical protein
MSDDQPKPDPMREMCIQQGYVPATCRLPGFLVWAETSRGVDACAGCNLDRRVCGGRPKRPAGGTP